MRALLRLATVLLVVVFACLNLGHANSFLPLGYVGGGGSPPSYTGPGDLATFTAFYSFRCYNQAKATPGTTKVVNLTRASDSTSMDIVCKNTGDFDTATASTFCAATTCTGWFYDQVGSLDLSSAVDTFPTLTFNCINTSLPCWLGAGANNVYMVSPATYTPTQDVASIYAIAERQSGSTNSDVIMTYNGIGGAYLKTRGSVANNWTAIDTTTGACINITASDGTAHLAIYEVNGASSSIAIDGGTASTGTCTGDHTITGRAGSFWGNTSAPSDELNIYEIGFKDSATVWTGTEQTNLHTNASSYWGTP